MNKVNKFEELWFGDSGDQLYAAIEGRGSTLIFYHGNFGTGENVLDMLRPLVQEFHVVAPDARGFGRSSCTSADRYTWTQYADDVVRLMDELGLESSVLGGGSFGSMVTIATALRHPDRIRACILLDPVALGNDIGWHQRQLNSSSFRAKLKVGRTIDPNDLSKIVDYVADAIDGATNSATRRRFYQTHSLESIAVMWSTIGPPWGPQPFDDLSELGDIEVPTLIIGGNDEIHLPEVAEEYHARIANSTLIDASPNGGGEASIEATHDSGAIARTISKFLNRVVDQ